VSSPAGTDLTDDLLEFLRSAPSPFHATEGLRHALASAGFTTLDEGEPWQLAPGGRYVVLRDGSSLIAFQLARHAVEELGLRVVGAHTDSPCLKLRPRADLDRHGYRQLGVEVYGGALLAPWFDRDLSIAGRVSYARPDGTAASALADFRRPLAVIPSLAIHLNRDVHVNRTINPHTELVPVTGLTADGLPDLRALLQRQLRDGGTPDVDAILDYDLFLYDTQPAARLGIDGEFIASARLDNLLSCYVGMRSLIDAPRDCHCMLVCNDHEEVGSQSAAGAQGSFLHSVLSRIAPDPERYARMVHRSMLVSADNAHGVHPNYADRHDEQHKPLLNAGPVIKINASQRYASTAQTAAAFRRACQARGVPVQLFSSRNDVPCGSTIGPITAARTGLPTVDVGVATFAMHSARELAGADDPGHLYQALLAFFESGSAASLAVAPGAGS